MKDKATIIVFSDGMDKVLAAFNIATGAAASGMDVTLFFTFWGLNVVKKERASSTPVNWMKRMFGLVNRGSARRLKLSKFNMMGMGTGMMKKIMKNSRFPQVEELIGIAKDLGVNIYACSTSMDMMGVAREDLIPAVNSVCGVATYLESARDSKINLFI